MSAAIRTVLLYLFLFCGFHFALGRSLPLVREESGSLYLSDFLYHLFLARAVWFEGLGSPYTLAHQEAVMSAVAGRPFHGAMPVGVLPFAWFIWLPLAWLARFDPLVANSAWVGLSLTLFIVFGWDAARRRDSQNHVLHASLLTFGVAILSEAFVRGVLLGQTSLVAAASLLALDRALRSENTRFRFARSGVPLLLLGIKPTYLLLGIALFVVYRRWRELVGGAVLLTIVSLLVTPVLSFSWPRDYFASLLVYTSPVPPLEYAQSLVGSTMNVFRFAVVEFLSAESAMLISRWGTLLGALGGAWLLYEDDLRLRWAGWWGLVSTLFLFPPHLGVYEEVLLVGALLVLLQGESAIQRRLRANQLLLITGVAATLNFIHFSEIFSQPVMFLIKAALVSGVLVQILLRGEVCGIALPRTD